MDYISIPSIIIAPLIALFVFFFLKKKSSLIKQKYFSRAYLGGMLAYIPVFLILMFSNIFREGGIRDLTNVVIYAFLITGFSTAFSMYLLVRYFFSKKGILSRPSDAILICISVSLGMSTISCIVLAGNLLSTRILTPIILHSYTLTAANMVFAILLGFFMGFAEFKRNSLIYNFTGLLSASFFSGLYTFCLMLRDLKLLLVFSFGSVIIVFFLTYKAMISSPHEHPY